jgi:cell division protein FtsL
VRAVAYARALPDHPLLDRIIRGRTWIALLGLMLAGIVAMQVEVLKLGASVGQSLQQGAALQSRNDLLRASVASLADDQRIERIAAQYGMVMPAPGAVVFLPRSRVDAVRAAANIHPADATSFVVSLAAATAAAGASTTSSTATMPGVGLTPTNSTGASATVSATGAATAATSGTTSTTGATQTAGNTGAQSTAATTATQTVGNTGAPSTGGPAAGNTGTPTSGASSSGAAAIGTPGG